MKPALIVILACLLPTSTALAQSQSSLDIRADKDARAADSTLNVVYHRLERRYAKDSLALRKLRTAERAWIAFRDAELAARYPAVDQQRAYGSALPMCVSALVEELTRARIAQLRQALTPEEGDVCAGGPAEADDSPQPGAAARMSTSTAGTTRASLHR